MTFGEKLKGYRLQAKLTQDELAKKLFVDRTAITRWENNSRLPNIETVKKLAAIFGVSIDELLSEEEMKRAEQQTKAKENDEVTPPSKNKPPVRKIIDTCMIVLFALTGVAGASLITGGLLKTFEKPEDSSTSEVNLGNLQSIYVSQNPTYMTYVVGQTFNSDGLEVKGVYDSGSEEVITGYDISLKDPFTAPNRKQTCLISYYDEASENTFTTLLEGISVYSSYSGVFTPVGLEAASGPAVQKENTTFDKTGLSLYVKYDVNGEIITDTSKKFTIGQNSTNNSYDQIKLVNPNQVLTSETRSVDIYYSQGKSSSIPVDVVSRVTTTCKYQTLAATEELKINDISIKGTKSTGEEITIDPSKYNWVDNISGDVTFPAKFSTNGTHTIFAENFGVNFSASFDLVITGGIEAGGNNSDLNEDYYYTECEDMEITGASVLKQTGDNYLTNYVDSNCDYGSFHAAAYLGYNAPYEANGKGFVHNFDTSRDASMTYSFNALGGGKADLILRGATNIVNTGKYSATALNVGTAANIELNGVSINSKIKTTDNFVGKASGAADPQNINTTHAETGFSLNGRYLYLLWTDVTIKGVDLKVGKNTITITAANASSSGHWDSIKFDITPYKNGGSGSEEGGESGGSETPTVPETLTGTKYNKECEDMTLANCSYLKQTGDNYKTDFIDSKCGYGSFHAEAYLGYTAPYEASGKGFVHNFDARTTDSASMECTITTEKEGYGRLSITGATNYLIDKTNYSAGDLIWKDAFKIYVNDEDVSSLISDTNKFEGKAAGAADPQNRNYNATSLNTSLNGRYLYLLWDEDYIDLVKLNKGENKIKLVPLRDGETGSGHFDKMSFQFYN